MQYLGYVAQYRNDVMQQRKPYLAAVTQFSAKLFKFNSQISLPRRVSLTETGYRVHGSGIFNIITIYVIKKNSG